MCCLRVSDFLTEITQQIHSLRASGVISSHFARAAGSEMRSFRKSAGTLCTAPPEIAFFVIDFILHRYAIDSGLLRKFEGCTRELRYNRAVLFFGLTLTN
jgi:hypothetical protein